MGEWRTVWEKGKAVERVDLPQQTLEQANKSAPDYPHDEKPTDERHLPKSWLLCIYGIPTEHSTLRARLRGILRAGGLWSIDLGGSVYLGPRTTALDDKVQRMMKEIEDVTGMKGLVNFFVGDYDETTAAFFRDRVVSMVMSDLQLVEESIDQLEKAIAGQVVIKREEKQKDGKKKEIEVDLLSVGQGRIHNAKALLEGMENVAYRFQGSAALEREAERIQLRVRQVRAWVDRVEKGFQKWASIERAKRRKE